MDDIPAEKQPVDPEDGYRVRYFGRRWNAPAFDDAVQVPVPLGAVCLMCGELVDEGDSGVMQAAWVDGGATVAAVHIECHLRSIVGCVAHLERRCSCFGGGEHEGSGRAAARAVLEWLVAEQTAKGLPRPGFVD